MYNRRLSRLGSRKPWGTMQARKSKNGPEFAQWAGILEASPGGYQRRHSFYAIAPLLTFARGAIGAGYTRWPDLASTG